MNAFTFESYEYLHEFLTSPERLQLMRNLLPLLEATSIAQISGTENSMYVCIYACMHKCMYAYMHVCIYACIYMYVCMYAINCVNGEQYTALPTSSMVMEPPCNFHFCFPFRVLIFSFLYKAFILLNSFLLLHRYSLLRLTLPLRIVDRSMRYR